MVDYPAAVRQHFFHPRHVGPLVAAEGTTLCRGEGGSTAAGAWVVMEAEVHQARVQRLAFRAYGCPWLIAACSLATDILAPGPMGGLADFDSLGLARQLEIPAEKLGTLLFLQDALRNCFGDWDTTQPAGAR